MLTEFRDMHCLGSQALRLSCTALEGAISIGPHQFPSIISTHSKFSHSPAAQFLMYRASDKKPETSVADVVMEVIRQGAHRKAGEASTTQSIILTPSTLVFEGPNRPRTPEVSISDLVLDGRTYAALHKAASHPQTPRFEVISGRHRISPSKNATGQRIVRTTPPNRSLSGSSETQRDTADNRKNKTRVGLRANVRSRYEAFFARVRSALRPRSH
ncbi:hypothetical protein PM082_015273 [Marasmius tenuissimus]|nr:hypothetical protein PM082_015273 [Marasmius tenuissimus]